MDPIGRKLNSEERDVLTVLTQEGRDPRDCTAAGVAEALERDEVDVAGALTQLERDGLTSSKGEGLEQTWAATSEARGR